MAPPPLQRPRSRLPPPPLPLLVLLSLLLSTLFAALQAARPAAASASAAVWTGGGPGPPGIVGVRGAPLWLPCKAANPRAIAQVRRKQSNILGISKNYTQVLHEDEEPQKENQRKSEKKHSYHEDDDQYENINEDDDTTQFEDDGEDYLSDGGYENRPRRRNEDGRRKSNKKLNKKTLDGDIKKGSKSQRNSMEYDTDTNVTYKWFHNGSEIMANDNKRTVMENGTLFFKRFGGKWTQRLGLLDTGEYRCLASSSHGAILSLMVLLQYASLETFTEFPTDSLVYEGDPFRLPCSIRSVPRFNITWEKDSFPLIGNKRYYFFPSGTLLITNSQMEDSGSYRCTLTNSILNKTIYSPAANITVSTSSSKLYNLDFVNIDASDNFEFINADNSTKLRNVNGMYGEDIFLGCAVKGRPKPKVIWSFQADREIESRSKKEFNSMEILRLPQLTESNSGTYSCIATNGNQTIQQAYHLTVLRAPYLKQMPISEYTPTARTVRFNCSAGGSPTPKITWFKDGKQLSITGRLKMKSVDRRLTGLIISDTVSADRGVYQCLASNSLGEAEAWGVLSVRSSEGVTPPTLVQCLPLNSETVRITWKPPNRLNVLAYTIHIMLEDAGEEHLEIWKFPNSADMKKLLPFERYEFYLKAYNYKRGASDQSNHVVCHGQGVPVILYSLTNGSVLLSWRETAKAVPNIVEWKLQLRHSQSEDVFEEITLPKNTSTYLMDVNLPDKFEYRMLASTSHTWLKQNLSALVWSSGNKTLPYSDQIFMIEEKMGINFVLTHFNMSRDVELNETNLSQLDGFSKNWTQWYPPKLTNVSAYATGPHTINITWKCETADSNPNGYYFTVCYSPYYEETVDDEISTANNENCVQSSINWIEVSGLKPSTLYAFRIQLVLQNQLDSGPFSENFVCRTKHDVTDSVVDVRWVITNDGTIKVSWVSNMNRTSTDAYLKNKDRVESPQSIVYTVFYSNNPTALITDWKSKNVTNTTQTEITDVNLNEPCYIMVSLMGEEQGPIVFIPEGGKVEENLNMSNSASLSDEHLGIILGVFVTSMCFIFLGGILLWQHKKIHNSQNAQSSQIRTNRVGRSDYECQELVSPSAHVDTKGGVVYMNGISNAKKRKDEVALLNGHVNITENPRFISKKFLPNGNSHKGYGPVLDGTLDLSRYEEPDPTMETILENDTTLEVPSFDNSTTEDNACPDSPQETTPVLPKSQKNGKQKCDHIITLSSRSIELTDAVVAVDRNSNSEISKSNDNTGDKERATFRPECNTIEATVALNYRGNSGARRLAPALGPNG